MIWSIVCVITFVAVACAVCAKRARVDGAAKVMTPYLWTEMVACP